MMDASIVGAYYILLERNGKYVRELGPVNFGMKDVKATKAQMLKKIKESGLDWDLATVHDLKGTYIKFTNKKYDASSLKGGDKNQKNPEFTLKTLRIRGGSTAYEASFDVPSMYKKISDSQVKNLVKRELKVSSEGRAPYRKFYASMFGQKKLLEEEGGWNYSDKEVKQRVDNLKTTLPNKIIVLRVDKNGKPYKDNVTGVQI